MVSINKVLLFLSNRCNLSCSYCFVSTKDEARLSTKQISIFIKWFLEQNCHTDYRELDFFGGEPFLELDLLQMSIPFFREQNRDKKSQIHTIPVNGTILTEEMLRFSKEQNLSVSISLDGDRTSNAGRKFKQGGDSFDIIWGNMQKFREFMGCPPQIKMTVTPDNVKDLFANVNFLFEEGFYNVYPNPAHIKVKWAKSDVDVYLNEFKKILQLYIIRRSRKQPIEIAPIDALWRKKAEDLVMEDFSCGYGTQPMLHPDGNIYICEHSFSEQKYWKDLFCVGSIVNDSVHIDFEKMRKLADYNIFTQFDLRNKNHPLAPIFSKMACCSFTENNTFLNKEDIENALDMYLLSSDYVLKSYERLKQKYSENNDFSDDLIPPFLRSV
ncbi:MAG: hypothetical protein A2Y03_09480 [Omnitrophica WOR_2 bacterium GWF2_38_59]|nr:MAG: hypothetical protein A2Y03_09480 [Omnitrophica WOR_2 bacterium GWF2_38_59]OGX49589.1 MAG: hypothetical protein A2243_11685 [Omnitrophica WOR_2 bacterium RIFOXYA2_FULL_38_17]OGX58871.1 MAG: hypothetical protein A2306_10785 [Omnitrophica WOR_2 bacterium RIFOXYB2_FULL_38_16]HBG61626.1 hypothetical protein [Candidatus Omnitrophota bacterium]